VLEITSDSTLQLNVSGAMAKTISHLTNLYSTITEELTLNSTHKNKENIQNNSNQSLNQMISHKSLSSVSNTPVIFKNHIEFPIEIFDSITHESLMVLRAGTYISIYVYVYIFHTDIYVFLYVNKCVCLYLCIYMHIY
jgi:hypothetical protein